METCSEYSVILEAQDIHHVQKHIAIQVYKILRDVFEFIANYLVNTKYNFAQDKKNKVSPDGTVGAPLCFSFSRKQEK